MCCTTAGCVKQRRLSAGSFQSVRSKMPSLRVRSPPAANQLTKNSTEEDIQPFRFEPSCHLVFSSSDGGRGSSFALQWAKHGTGNARARRAAQCGVSSDGWIKCFISLGYLLKFAATPLRFNRVHVLIIPKHRKFLHFSF